jgi:hypothetical protein
MSDEIMEEVQEVVEAAKAPGTFNILNLLRERAYPEYAVTVYIDEAAAFAGGEIDELIASTKDDAEVEKLTDRRDEIIAELKKSAITFHLKGISESRRNDLLKQAKKKYPIEYTRDVNPMSGEMVKDEKPSPERDELFTDFLWQASISKIEDAEGNTQENIGFADVSNMRSMLPLASIARVTEAIEKIRVATAVFMHEVNEDFLPKP